MRALVRFSRRELLFHVVAVVLCTLAMSRGIRTTADLEWPGDPDHLRDIGHAQTIQDGSFQSDPSYLGERFWYNPLVPALLAGLSSLTGIPIHVLHVRGGAYLNLAAPAAFYVMCASLLGAPSALVALSVFLFLSREPSWLTATYSPWLFTANFVQAFFYVAILVYLRAFRRRDWVSHVATGVALGTTFLGHTAPAVLLGTIVVVATGARVAHERDARYLPIAHLLVVVAVAALVASPLLLSIVAHYGLHVRNPIPSSWLDEALRLDNWRAFALETLRRPVLNGFLVVALGRLIVAPPRRRGVRLLMAAWLGGSVALLVWSAYGPQLLPSRWIPQVVPAHHFLVYVRAAEALLVGHGVWVTASASTRMLRGARTKNQLRAPSAPRRGARALTMAAVALLVAWTRPYQDERFDFSAIRPRALRTYADAETRDIFAWIRRHSQPASVFLTAENSGLSIVTVAGRKAVSVPLFFSNPYVDYGMRSEARRLMWEFLDVGDCLAFRRAAQAFHVSHVLAIRGSTPVLSPGRCGLDRVYAVGGYEIFRVRD